MRYFPAFFDVKDKPVLIIIIIIIGGGGGGDGGGAAIRKPRLLSKAGARLRIIAPEFMPEFAEEFAGQSAIVKCAFDKAVSEPRPVLLVAATGDPNADAFITLQQLDLKEGKS